MRKFRTAALFVVALVSLAGVTQAIAGPLRLTHHHRALSRARIRRDAASGRKRVVVVLRNQRRGLLATTSSRRTRAKHQARERRPLLAQVRHAGGAVTHQYQVLNAFAATV